jgi:transposase-like protein
MVKESIKYDFFKKLKQVRCDYNKQRFPCIVCNYTSQCQYFYSHSITSKNKIQAAYYLTELYFTHIMPRSLYNRRCLDGANADVCGNSNWR